MRGLILLTMCTATLAHAAWNGYVETRETSLDADGIDSLQVEAGAGSLSVKGDPGIGEIQLSATIRVPGADEAKAREVIAEDMVLTMDRTGSTAVLESYFESTLFDWGEAPRIDLEITLPARLGLAVDDGSGPVDIVGVDGPLDIDDGSGSLAVTDAGGDVDIDDGSGSIRVAGAAGDVTVVDGSGSIVIEKIAGTVIVDDGSGSIRVDDVREDLIIRESGSGSVDYTAIAGIVEYDE